MTTEQSWPGFTTKRISGIFSGALTHSVQQLDAPEGLLPIGKELFADGVWIFENSQLPSVGLAYPDKAPYVTIQCDGFTGDFAEKPGSCRLDTKENFIADYAITIF